MARQFFGAKELSLAPEEYAARHGQEWGCFSFHCYRYRDAALGHWIRRVAEILFDQAELERWRERLLTPQELAEVRRREAERF
jgi:hypothetical protein